MVQDRLEKILKEIAYSEELTNYEIYPHIDAVRGDGFLSEFYTGEVVDKGSALRIQTYIKIPPLHSIASTSWVFGNELQFYNNIFPKLDTFQKNNNVKNPFHGIPKFYSGNNIPGEEYVAMENLKLQNYTMVDKSKFIQVQILKDIFRLYGKFHALSFAFKEQYLEEYLELVAPLKDVLVQDKKVSIARGIKFSFTQAYKIVEGINQEIAEKLKPYVENFEEIYFSAMSYNGKYSALTHGDCWSNNMLFKFQGNGTIEDIKFVDFQLCRDSTPIHDLSYFFYSGASKEDFKKLDEYLELYHKSFSAFARELGSDPEKLLPLNVLKSEWKKHSLLGIFMGILLWQVKLMNKDKIEDVTTGQPVEGLRQSVEKIKESNTFKENTSAILLHAVEYGIL